MWAIEEYSKYLLKDLRERIYYLLSLFFDEEIDLTILAIPVIILVMDTNIFR